MPPQARWHDDIPAAGQLVACGRAVHEITWHRGRIGLAGHSVNAERALRVFGGRAPDCVMFVDEWMRGLRRPRFLDEWAKLDRGEPARRGWYAQVWNDRVIDDDDWMAPLAYFSDAMLDRLAYSTIRRVLRDDPPPDPHRESSVVRATRVRARRAFVESLRAIGLDGAAGALVRLDFHIGGSPDADGVLGSPRASWARVTLPRTWILDVFARGMGVVDGRFVLAAAAAGEGRGYRARTLVWEESGRAAVRPALVTPAGASWSVVG